MKTLLLTIILTVSGFAAYADTIISAQINTPIRIRTESPEPKQGGGDFYTVKVTPKEGMTAETGIPETTLTFSAEGTYPVEISVIHITKSSCGGVETKTYSKERYSLIISK
jgi:hypothetical protein